jgi:hypothetical protein
MYTFKQNTKNLCFALIAIGLVAIGYGFYSASASHYSDLEIKEKVKTLYYELKSSNKAQDTASNKTYDSHIDGGHHAKTYKFSKLFHAIEDELHCHFSEEEIERAETLDDVIYTTKHYFHAKKQRPWSSLFVSNLFFLMISLAGLVWLAVQYISQSGWSASLLRIPQAVSSFLPFGGAIMLFIIITGALHWHHTYHWMDSALTNEYVYENSIETDHPRYTDEKVEGVVKNKKYDYIIDGKTAYLNIPFFILRAFIYLLGWCLAAFLLRKYSLNEDKDGGIKWHNKMFTLSAIFIVFAAVTTSTGAWDWIMSIDTHWFSTLFGWYSFASFFVSACAVIAIITIHLKYTGYLPNVNENHMHDFGRYLLAFSIFWTYLWFAQYMLIWYSNIPEEVTYYLIRFESYHILIIVALLLNFVTPMLLIQDRAAKRLKGQVLFVAILILVGHFIDVFVMIMPGTVGTHWHLGFVEIGTFLGYVGFFTFVVLNTLSKAPLSQKNHPMLVESEHHHI